MLHILGAASSGSDSFSDKFSLALGGGLIATPILGAASSGSDSSSDESIFSILLRDPPYLLECLLLTPLLLMMLDNRILAVTQKKTDGKDAR